MNDKTLYQTVEDRNNPSEIETEGPFICVRNNISVSDVICFLKNHSDFSSQYKAIRAKATGCMKHSPTMRFVNYNIARLELMPLVQFCVIDKSFLLGDVYRIVYPAKYI